MQARAWPQRLPRPPFPGESQEASNKGGNGWRVLGPPRTLTALGSSDEPPEAVTF